ncbi:hypothetical protein P280DRAFT_455537 [Massarina eburnea CBS 473.64]|uniref:Zn(2)-C6 fungal-type domain-containing protein n=1 Tax=Massarina eburnea CBS 473.64 TaxID=1395130 RepID=A0A6A6RTI7_9PLEO|nr:hypothetical protein P280DRAFT_455537 [Massarina eburnea CBS 473.64]
MPRPKVKPQDRRRAVKACLSCKVSKVRCNAQSPCNVCVRRGRENSCVYSTETRSSSIATPTVRDTPSVANQEYRNEETDDADSIPEFYQDTRPLRVSSYDAETACQRSPTQSRTLMTSKGEKVYVGAASSLSFLQFVRQVVGRCTGSCTFTENESMNLMLEVPQHQHNESPISWLEDEADLQHSKRLLDASFEATSGILDLYDRDEIIGCFQEHRSEALAQGNTTPTTTRTDFAVACLALAIGSQCQSSTTNRTDPTIYFAQAQHIAFEGFLFDPSINIVRIFLLMAFYMLGACHRNAACMYLGVAAKAATTLGLHQAEQYSSCTKEEVRVRLRCWRSLRVLDTLVNAILGRTTSTVSMYSSIDARDDIYVDTVSPNSRSLVSMYRLCLIVENVQQQLSGPISLDPAVAEKLLQKLGKWTQTLPEDLRNFTVSNTSPLASQKDRELVIGATHVACSYYFTVAIVTRPFLISHLMAQLQLRQNNNILSIPPGDAERTAKLAEACIEAAIYMAQICADAVQSNMLHDNMCILKAWVFAAGLLLGFSLFIEEGVESTRATVADAYNSSCVVLHHFARLSPQAEHYYGILNNFADAITKYHQQLAESKRRSTGKYVYRIFSIASEGQEGQTQSEQMDSLGHAEEDGSSIFGGAGNVDEFMRLADEEDEVGLANFWNEISLGTQLSTFF